MTDNLAPDSAESTAIPRRTVAAAGMVAVAGVLTACTQYGNPAAQSTGGGAGTQPNGGGAGNEPTAAGGGGTALGKTSDVPVGGGAIFKNEQVVVTQPKAGAFKAFSAVCTHQGCIVATVANGTINCNCHGSKFKIADGSVANGPASTPLPERSVTVTGDQITLS
jgi:Rieske Fe-S protein